MARTDPLDQTDPLKPARFGHAPALWLALPLLAGCAWDAYAHPEILPLLWVGSVCTLGLWLCARHELLCRYLLVCAGVSWGAAWHQAKLPPQAPLSSVRAYAELSVRVESATLRRTGEGWTGLGIITDKGPLFRRRLALAVKGEVPARGAELKITGHLTPLPHPSTGYDAWISSQGATLKLSGGRTLGVLEPPGRFAVWCQERQRYLEHWLRVLPWEDPDGGALLAATMLGRTSLLPEDAKAAFTATGTLHLFAISGLHIAGMAAALLWATRRLRLPERPTGIAILALLWVYVEVTGASPSSLRAWIMAAFLWAGQVGERATPPLQSLALAAAATLLWSPEASSDPGFQLSYLAVLAIFLVGLPAAEQLAAPTLAERLTPPSATPRWRRWVMRLRRATLSGLCISLAATIAGTPLTLTYFQSMSWAGVFANLVLVPLSEIPLVLGMASLLCCPWPALLPLAAWLNGAAAATLDVMNGLTQAFARLPGLALNGQVQPTESGPLCAALLVACFFSQAETKSAWRLLGVPALLVLAWILACVAFN
jgi:competence protein ComEC